MVRQTRKVNQGMVLVLALIFLVTIGSLTHIAMQQIELQAHSLVYQQLTNRYRVQYQTFQQQLIQQIKKDHRRDMKISGASKERLVMTKTSLACCHTSDKWVDLSSKKPDWPPCISQQAGLVFRYWRLDYCPTFLSEPSKRQTRKRCVTQLILAAKTQAFAFLQLHRTVILSGGFVVKE